MEITRTLGGEFVSIELVGRLDGYWSDHLTSALTDAVREGHHHIRLDCSGVNFLSSAGIGVLMKFHKELARINGTFLVVNASAPVSTVLRITRLAQFLVEPPGTDTATTTRERQPPARRIERDDVGFDVFDLDARASLTCRAIGTAAPLATGGFVDEHCTSLESLVPTLAVGVGAFGDSFADCGPRFGELLSVAGATAYQPADGTNVADYLVATGALRADVRVLYCLACEGRFSHLVRFETLQPGATVGLARLLLGCLEAAGAKAIGVVVVAEAAGLVGAALRRSPSSRLDDADFFTHPGVRTRLSFTAERAYARSVALAAGVVGRGGGAEQLRPIGPDCVGHVHAAAFRFRPIRKGPIDFTETVAGLFEPDQLMGVLHLLHDDRGAGGAGESELVRGACWVGPIAAGEWPST